MNKQILFVLMSSAALIFATPAFSEASHVVGRGLENATGSTGTSATSGTAASSSSTSSTMVGRGIEKASEYASKASGYMEKVSQAAGEVGKAVDSANKVGNLANVSVNSVGDVSGAVNAAGSAAQGVNSLASQFGELAGVNTEGVGKAAGYVSKYGSELSGAASSVNDIAGLTNVSFNSIDDISGAANSLNSAVKGASSLASQVGKYTDWDTSGFGSAAGKVSQAGNAINSAASDVGNIMKVGDISINSVSDLTGAISSVNSAASSLGSLSGQIDKYLGSNIGGSLGSVTDKDSILGSLTGATGEVSSLIGEASGALDLIQNPKNLMQMGLGMVSFENLSNLAMNAATDVLTDLLSSAGVGIPISDSKLKETKANDAAAKKESTEKDNKIAGEKEKQMDALGSRPKTPADSVPQTQDAKTNPSIDNCPAYMAQFPDASNLAYDFIKENMLDKKEVSKYGPVKDSMTSAIEYVKSTYYIKDAKDITDEKRMEIQNKRQDYLREVNADVLAYGIGVQQNLVEDAKSISLAPTSGCDYIDDINKNTLIMIALAKQTIADIALQINMLELEAVRQTNSMPIEILEKPKEEK